MREALPPDKPYPDAMTLRGLVRSCVAEREEEVVWLALERKCVFGVACGQWLRRSELRWGRKVMGRITQLALRCT